MHYFLSLKLEVNLYIAEDEYIRMLEELLLFALWGMLAYLIYIYLRKEKFLAKMFPEVYGKFPMFDLVVSIFLASFILLVIPFLILTIIIVFIVILIIYMLSRLLRMLGS